MCSKFSNSNNLTASIAEKRDPGFQLVVALEFYDGPEYGVAILPNGEGVRFTSLGESRGRLFRAFKLELLHGDWRERCQMVQELRAHDPRQVVFLPSERTDELDNFEKRLRSEAVQQSYVGVADPYFQWVAAIPATQTCLELSEAKGFRYVHKLLKSFDWSKTA